MAKEKKRRMFLEKDDFQSDIFKGLYDKYFGYLVPDEPVEEKQDNNNNNNDDDDDNYHRNYQNRNLRDDKSKKVETRKVPELDDLLYENEREKEVKVIELFPGKKESKLKLDEGLSKENIFDEFDAEVSEDFRKDSLQQKVSEPQIVSKQYLLNDIFSELLQYYKANDVNNNESIPVLEEDANCLLATVAAASKHSLLIEGKARTGKSLILDQMTELLTSVYSIKNCSNKSFFGSADEINKNDFLYISEFQSAVQGNPVVKEILKMVTENKDATHDSKGMRTTLCGNLTVLSTGADENILTQKRDVEVSGRFIILKTRSDLEKTKKICDYQDGLKDGTIEDVMFSKDRFDNLKNHINQTVEEKGFRSENPFIRSFSENLPQTQKSVYYRTLYHSLIDAFTKFDRQNRLKKENGKFLTNIIDIYLVNTLYHKTYCQTLKRLAAMSYEAIERTLSEVEKEDQKKEYEQEISLIEEVENKNTNWQKIWNGAYEHMAKNNPQLLNQWVASQSKEGKIIVYNPVKKVDVYLCEAEPISIKEYSEVDKVNTNSLESEELNRYEIITDPRRLLPEPKIIN